MSLFEVVTNWVEGHTRGRDEDRYGFDNHDAAKDYANERLRDADTAKVVIRNTETGEEKEWKANNTIDGGAVAAAVGAEPQNPPLTPPTDVPPMTGEPSAADSQATADELNAEEAAANPAGDNPPPSFDPAPAPPPMPGDANPKTDPPTNT